MIRIEIHVTPSALNAFGRVKKVLTSRKALVGLGLGVAIVPIVALASPVDVPNTFVANTVISSADMNENFAAVEAAVNDNDSRITALEATVAPHACEWAVNGSTANSTNRIATCPANKFAIAGGCRGGNDTAPDLSVPRSPEPANGALAATATEWYCEWPTSSVGHVTYAMCCSF